MERDNERLEARRVPEPMAIVHINWIYLTLFVLAFVMTLPYLLSPYVFIVHNPVDDALVAFLGVAYVKPVLYLCIIIGGLVGLIVYPPLHRLYMTALREHVIQIGRIRILLLAFVPIIVMFFSHGLQAIWDYICPLPNTGNLLSVFFNLPVASFGIVASLLSLIEYYRAKHHASLQGLRLQFTMIRRKLDSFRLELVPLHDKVDPLSASQSIDIS
ncbi:MAG: hypothetical protein K9W43_03830 [Candidatus Thorarchaeota archaeon]|nr:hypothetical protein [Candidatus Thorarchaeota archaeon]